MNTFTNYINDALSELRQVRWPTRQQAIRLSIIVIGFTAVATIFFGAIDYALAEAVSFILSLTY